MVTVWDPIPSLTHKHRGKWRIKHTRLFYFHNGSAYFPQTHDRQLGKCVWVPWCPQSPHCGALPNKHHSLYTVKQHWCRKGESCCGFIQCGSRYHTAMVDKLDCSLWWAISHPEIQASTTDLHSNRSKTGRWEVTLHDVATPLLLAPRSDNTVL